MPLFDPRNKVPRQLLTPPEFVPSYQSGCGGMPYQQSHYSQPAIRQHDDGYDFSDRYGQLAVAMPPMYPQAGTYLSSQAPTLPPPSSFYDSAGPTLPPMRTHNNGPLVGDHLRQQRQQQEAQRMSQPPPKEEKPVGGVSAKLDYDMNVMTDFVCDTALRIITPGGMMPQSFRKWVHQLLCATRLPSATILLSMFYLSNRMPMLSGQPKNDSHLYRLLTIALVLGSKFLDDNTFINHSWSEVSGIPVKDLNRMETDWLVAIDFKLHRDPNEQHGWKSWSDHWCEYQARSTRVNKLSPIDTTVQRRSMHINPNKPLPPLPMQQNYNTPPPPYEFAPKSAQTSYTNSSSFSQYDPWRSTSENSPASAPTTGPTTPEYYGASGAWAPAEGYSRRTMFGFPPLSQPAVSQSQQPSNYGPPSYTTSYSAPAWSPTWNAHGYDCGCVYCSHRHAPYMLARYGSQPVAV